MKLLACLALLLWLAVNSHAQPQITHVLVQSNHWIRLDGLAPQADELQVRASTDLAHWEPIANLAKTNGHFSFLDPSQPSRNARFYVLCSFPTQPTNDWRNQILFPDDPFVSAATQTDENSIQWVKFCLVLKEPARIYYQDSTKYVLHHEFATARLPGFEGMTRTAFDQVSLHPTNQQIVLGTVMIPPQSKIKRGIREYGVQIMGQEPYPGEMVAHIIELVRSTVIGAEGAAVYYLPAFEQTSAAQMDEAYLEGQGIPVSRPDRWLSGDQVYSPGWALGRLVSVTATNLMAAYTTGLLHPEDIVLIDAVPSEMPFVSGIISLTPSTPSSHVAILAESYRVPFVYLADAATRAQAQQLAGKEVVLQGRVESGFHMAQIIKVDGTMEAAFKAELLAYKTVPPTRITPKATYGSISASTDALKPSDSRYFGGKAANYGVIRRAVPTNSEPAVAFSMDLWDAFMDQELPGGVTLRAEINARLAPFTYPPDIRGFFNTLAMIRAMITQTAKFSASQQSAITNALAQFDPNRNIRFRSSSNAEDSASFTAAGLYDSFSGCLADDLDGDDLGPSHGDPTEAKERGVFRAMQKVYASFYNDNGCLERLRHGIDESQVGMGILAHYSYPDDQELANGVAEVTFEASGSVSQQLTAHLTAQTGAVSITNPDTSASPEVTACGEASDPEVLQASGLVPLGARVMTWDSDYRSLSGLLFTTYKAYCAAVNKPAADPINSPLLDFEFKRIKPGVLFIKQVRELPRTLTSNAPPYLLNEPASFWPYPRESTTVFANHRLKCRLLLETKNMRVTAATLSSCFYSRAVFEYRQGTNLVTLSGDPGRWAEATHSVTEDPRAGTVVTDSWVIGAGADRRTYQLISALPSVNAAVNPFLPVREIRKRLHVAYATPQPCLTWDLRDDTLTEEAIYLMPQPDPASLGPSNQENLTLSNLFAAPVTFLSPPVESSPFYGMDKNFWGVYPAVYSPQMETDITGLASKALRLRGYYSQTAVPGHKNRGAWFLFEPEMEACLDPDLQDELRKANIKLIHVSREGWSNSDITIILQGFDGRFRAWP